MRDRSGDAIFVFKLNAPPATLIARVSPACSSTPVCIGELLEAGGARVRRDFHQMCDRHCTSAVVQIERLASERGARPVPAPGLQVRSPGVGF